MKKHLLFTLATCFTVVSLCAQQPVRQQPPAHDMHHSREMHDGHHGHKPQPAPKNEPRFTADGIAVEIAKAFPTAKSTQQNKQWIEVYNAKKQFLGYAVYSKPASNGIKGYNGETPLLIAFTPKKKVQGVWLLPNQETPKFERRVADAGLYQAWNGKSIRKAKKTKVDIVSGATYTSRAVIQSMQAALNNL